MKTKKDIIVSKMKQEYYVKKANNLCNKSRIISMIKHDMMKLQYCHRKYQKIIMDAKILEIDSALVTKAQRQIMHCKIEYNVNREFMRMYLNFKLRR